MADRELKKSWLRDARKAAVGDVPGQIAWLEVKRTEYKTLMDEGDQETNSSSFEGGSSTGKRHLSAKDHHDAIMAGMEDLEAAEGLGTSSKAAVIIPRFSHILS